jgi:S-formylglutathione hydrolase FrmB
MATLRIKFLATSVGMQMHLMVFLPEPLAGSPACPGERLRVLWLLHAEAGDCSDWLRLSMIEHHAQAANLALVMPNLNNSMCMNMAHGGYPYFDYLTQELPRHVRHLVPVLSARREDNFVAGIGTGGHGAAKWLLGIPGMFAGCACLSGELDMVAALRHGEAEGALADDKLAAFGGPAQLEGTLDDIMHLISGGLPAGALPASLYLAASNREACNARNAGPASRLQALGMEVVTRDSAQESGWPFWDDALRDFIGRLSKAGRPDGGDAGGAGAAGGKPVGSDSGR